jgi:hypothetical protein
LAGLSTLQLVIIFPEVLTDAAGELPGLIIGFPCFVYIVVGANAKNIAALFSLDK